MNSLFSNTLVIVDDDQAHSVLIKRSLKRSGLKCKMVFLESGQQVLDYVYGLGEFSSQPRPFRLTLILDINMPGINGIQVLKKLKSADNTRHIPIFMLTTTDDPKEIDECYRHGCNAYVIKPVNHDAFVDRIRELGNFIKVIQIPHSI